MEKFKRYFRKLKSTMKFELFTIAIGILVLAVGQLAVGQVDFAAKSKKNMVVSVHPLATQAGIDAFEKGGNAIDAAIATAVTLGVVDGYNSGIGGGCFILIRRHDGQVIAIDGREMAPALAHRDMYLQNGKPENERSQIGPLAIGVPGALKAYHQAIANYGKMRFEQVLMPAAELAEKGFEISTVYSSVIQGEQKFLRQFPGSAAILLNPDGAAHQRGYRLKQTDLAATYRAIATEGIDWFYQGEFAKATEKWMAENGGIITGDDFRNYTTEVRNPIRSTYRGFEIIGFPPPSSGGIHVAQILNILESFDLSGLNKQNPALLKHIVAEAMKLAFADRAHWLGDPDFVKVPRQLISKDYAKQLASRIDLDRTVAVKSHGVPPDADSDFFAQHTTHLTTADSDGNWVAITTTVNTRFGAKVIIPGLGVVMNSQMDDFSIAPGVPNAYGLIGSGSNSIAPGKRPLSSMSPTFILKNGKPIFTVGAAGGPKIITQVVCAIINHLDLGMPVPDAIAAARIHHQWSPDLLMVEVGTKTSIVERLRQFGHRTQLSEGVGVSQAIGFDPESNEFTGAHDPRTPGKASGR